MNHYCSSLLQVGRSFPILPVVGVGRRFSRWASRVEEIGNAVAVGIHATFHNLWNLIAILILRTSRHGDDRYRLVKRGLLR